MIQAWWKEGVVYQIYPRSFADSNGDGIGDLRGIIGKLDYLKDLGVDIIWLSPVYQSPNDDNGYDISDYQAIMAEFGTMADFDELLEQMHRRGIRLLMDLVVNHSSDEHAWFVESRMSKDSPYREYYIWRPGKDGKEPNNWASFFSGSAWEYDAATDEYYLHLFSKKQPDLNWEHPPLREAVYAMMRWWLEKGIDGFRMDVINMISKAPDLPDAPVVNDGPYQSGSAYYIHGPRLLEFLLEMKRKALAGYDTLTVGEAPLATPEHAIMITHETEGSLNMLFQFEHMDLDVAPGGLSKWDYAPLDLRDLKRSLSRWQKGLEGAGWNSLYLSNHDQPRPVSRFADDGLYRVESAKMLATMLHMLQGTPYIYQGEEIGMTNVAFESINDYRDIETLNAYKDLVSQRGGRPEEIIELIHTKSRDNARTPMQWDDSPNAGFTSGTPWIKANPNYPQINVARDRAAADSIFAYYQQLIRLRKLHPVIVYGSYDLFLADHPQIYAFTRTLSDERLLIILNFSAEAPIFSLPAGIDAAGAALLVSNYPVGEVEYIGEIALRPYEARVYRLG
jgi:oligo-1,6-glucosidase